MTDPTTPPRARIRWKPPVVIVLLAILAIAALHHREWVETYIAAYATALVCLLTAVLLLIWLAFFSGLRLRTRLSAAVGLIVLAIAVGLTLRLTTRVEGTVSGVGVPRLVWKWSPPAEAKLSELPSALAQPDVVVDLSKTTPQDFPQFLGPQRTNTLTGAALSRDWTKPPRELWRHPVGLGWGSFAVVGNYAITQEQRESAETTVCYDAATGKPLWQFAHPDTRFTEWQGGDGPRATPTISNGRVYVMGATGWLDCLDGATGKPIWSRNVLAETHAGNTDFGKSSSPLVTDDLVIVTGGRPGPSLVAYRKDDGAPAWKAGDEPPGYASPLIATLAGVRQILTINAGSAAAYDPADGKTLWRYPWPGSMPKVPTPVALDPDHVFITCGYGIGSVVLQIKSDGGNLSVSPVWSNRSLKPKMSDVVVKGDFVFGLDDAILTCLDLKTGKRAWRGDNYGFGQLLLVDDLLLIQCEDGNVALVEANPAAFREVSRFQALSSKTWNNPALAGHRLLLRNDREAACFELP